MFHGGWRQIRLLVSTFISYVGNRHPSTSVVRAFQHTTAAAKKGRWWVLEWNLGTSKRESLLSTVLVLCLDLFQAASWSFTGYTCWICASWSTVNAMTLSRCSRLPLTTGSAAAEAPACLCCCCCYCRCCCCRCHGCWCSGRLAP